MSKKKEKKESRTYIGGQAVLEGVMMRGKTAYATAVRDPEGNIQVESRRLNASKGMKRVAKIPLVRGVVNFVSSLVTGSKILMRSAEVYGDEGKPSKFEKWCEEKLHINLMSAISFIATILGVVLAVGLFIVLPMVLVNLLVRTGGWLAPRSIGYNLLQGLFRLIIFILYIVAITAMKDIRRVFMYHGAEHKTITCFEKGMELTPENAKTCSRIHDRCGTTFLFLVMAISIVVFSVVNWVCDAYLDIFDYGTVVNFLIEFAIKILFLPIVAGISYEVLKLLAKSQSKILLPVKAPGFALQKLTTREPSEDMLEVAIAAFKKVYEMDADPSVPETDFTVSKSVQKYTEELKTLFAEKGIDESDAEWLVAMKTGVARSGLAESDKMLVPSEVKELDALAGERMAGKPLWYVLGSASFYGYEIKTDARALIPRPETEMLAELAIKTAEDGNSVLDLCTGSGCIAVAVANETKKQGKSVKVTASDISADALALAAENVKANGAEVALVESDLLSGIRGKFDVIVCNPPYIKRGDLSSLQSEVRDYEPMSALDGGEDGLDFYRRLAKDAPKKLKKGGTLLMECGQGQAQEIVKLFKKFDYAMITRDLEGVERYIRAVL
ncbi:MAG TPA: peptide chain release factor N(5)-glutamine methyltransferase [Candidatus Borkfalkia stercoripullorum]|nr:peptide chain release factor N(5)-glutamine methyltransferase [Candidatus Borkfalkia stercoripullorum]